MSSSQSRLSRYHCMTGAQQFMLSATGSAHHRCCAALMFAAHAACMCTR